MPRAVVLPAAAVVAAAVLAACGSTDGSSDVGGEAATSAGDVARGQELFGTSCAACHGEGAVGTAAGPSFLDPVYVPSHHGDAAFLLAVQRGVQPHHFDFGPMPAVPGLSPQDVADIVAYVRGLQAEAGLIEAG